MVIPVISSSWGGVRECSQLCGIRKGFSSPQPWAPVCTGGLTVDGADSNQIYEMVSGSEMGRVYLLSNSRNAEDPPHSKTERVLEYIKEEPPLSSRSKTKDHVCSRTRLILF